GVEGAFTNDTVSCVCSVLPNSSFSEMNTVLVAGGVMPLQHKVPCSDPYAVADVNVAGHQTRDLKRETADFVESQLLRPLAGCAGRRVLRHRQRHCGKIKILKDLRAEKGYRQQARLCGSRRIDPGEAKSLRDRIRQIPENKICRQSTVRLNACRGKVLR